MRDVDRPAPWQDAFVATSLALGEALDATLALLPPGDGCSPGLLRALRSSSRETRAHGLAAALAPVAAAISEMRVA